MAMGSQAIFSNSGALADAHRVRQAMPCSVAMPAGTGKTEIIAALARLAADEQQRVLILTHTHAGVDALRRRAATMGVPASSVRIDTIASWSHLLVRRYPYLAEITAAAEPDWSDSARYYEGAQRVAASSVLQCVLPATYAFAVIDEYQDCTSRQHLLAQAIAEAVPLAVFGDPLQAIFGWDRTDPLPPWREEVRRLWPEVPIAASPWRWKGHNENLGLWLLDIRPHFEAQRPIPIVGSPVRWLQADGYRPAIAACRQLRTEFPGDSIVAIGYREHDCRGVANKLNGSYGVMETIEGKDMVFFGEVIDRGDGPDIAAATATWAKDCITGISSMIKSSDVDRLRIGKPTATLSRSGAEVAHGRLSGLLSSSTPTAVLAALQAISALEGGAIYRYDAWFTVLSALRSASATGQSVARAVLQQRNQSRATGRRSGLRSVSRPTLIKGLEYDHGIVLDASLHDPTSLYVALTRARKTLTVISARPELSTAAPARHAKGRGRGNVIAEASGREQLKLL